MSSDRHHITGGEAAALLEAAHQRLQQARARDPELWAPALAIAEVADSAPRVFAASEYVAVSCERDPALLAGLAAEGRLLAHADEHWLAADLASLAANVTAESGLMAVLRRFRRRHMVRIAWRDLAGWASLEETLRDLSDLADVCIRFACARMYEQLVARYGVPRGEQDGAPQPLVTLGMGKLGGRELNFSSDIDLVFLYPEEGQTDGARSVDNAEFFLRLAQKMVQLLATPTEDGFVYRVDLRLRPFGDSGRVAVSFPSFEVYLQQHGRDWERYAYVKARAITGAQCFPTLYDEVLRPFVYRRYLDFGVFESLRDMKAMLVREVERRELKDDIKLGPGGIREIEFMVQAFQLIRGGSDPRLQSRQLRAALPLLVAERLLGPDAVRDLSEAYAFLRMIENRLQQWNDEQVHRLPAERDARLRLALAAGFPDWPALHAELERHRRSVSRHFALTVFGPVAGESGDAEAARAFDLEAPLDILERELEESGCAHAAALAAAIDQLRSTAYYRRLDPTGRRRLRELMPRLLKCIAGSAAPLTAFQRIAKILEMIGGRTVYLALLHENAAALRRLVDLCARSQFLADQVAAHPLLLDELIDERLLDEPPSRAQFEADLALRRAAMRDEDPERQVEMLRQFQNAAIFRVAVADLTGKLPLMKVSDRLTDIAELIVREALALAWDQMVARYGEPRCVETDGVERTAGMIVVAYGKFGGLELGYGSDLDLVFLHDSSGEVTQTTGPQVLDNTLFFQRLGQRLVHLLTVHTAAGRLYEVDTRLRPGGNRGLLVQSLAGFQAYEFEEAWTWEHQSLLRARAVAGPAPLREAFDQARVEVLRKGVRRPGLKQEVRRMRARMRENLSRASAGQFDIKQDAGGVADLEFVVQYWMLEWADRYPQIVTFTDNIRQLESLASGALVPQERVDFLVDTYRKYRERLHRLSLDGAGGVVPDTEFVAERRGVAAVWEEVLGT